MGQIDQEGGTPVEINFAKLRRIARSSPSLSQAEIDRVYRKMFERPCGARLRNGSPCKNPAVLGEHGIPLPNTRCRLHGGKSTGPRSAEGRAAIAESNRRRAAKRGRKDAAQDDESGA